jgi:hypothetical protein
MVLPKCTSVIRNRVEGQEIIDRSGRFSVILAVMLANMNAAAEYGQRTAQAGTFGADFSQMD